MTDENWLTKRIINSDYDDGVTTRLNNLCRLFFCDKCKIRMLYDDKKGEVFCPKCGISKSIIDKFADVPEKEKINKCNMCKTIIPYDKLLFRKQKNGRPLMWRGICENCNKIAVFSVELYFAGLPGRRCELITYEKYGVSPHWNTIYFLANNKEFIKYIDWNRVDYYITFYAKYKEKYRKEYARVQREDRFNYLRSKKRKGVKV